MTQVQVSEAYLRQLAEEFGSLRQRVERLERLESKVYTPCAVVTHNAAQTTTNNTNLVLAYNTAVSNNFGFWSSGDNTKLTVPAGYGGLYMISVSVRWIANATGYRLVVVRLNGATPLAVNLDDSSASEASSAFACVQPLADGDYIDSYVRQTSGGNLDVASLSQYSPVLTLTRIGSIV